ncbi:MAG: putative nucleic acid-binding Zn-ribbon protein [Salibacteraceae bacterium]|jgi:predicted  nucleic acid-binding Zn-ribbon protein
MAKAIIDPKLMSVEDKLRSLYRLQLIDSQIDKIQTIRGELPIQIQDLEDEIVGLQTRIAKMQEEKGDLDQSIVDKGIQIKDSEAAILKYKEQQNDVRNNREFDSLNKEIEFQELEIQLADKRTKEARARIASKEEVLETASKELTDNEIELKHKKEELGGIVGETEKEEDKLLALSEEAKTKIEERLLKAYLRIRNKVHNGLAVVAIDRASAGGSYIQIPPQRILDVGARKKIIVDEHSGRILVDQDLAYEEQEKFNS